MLFHPFFRLPWFALFLCFAGAAYAQEVTPPAVPVPPNPKDGAAIFAKAGCTYCHGPQGNGTDKAPSIHEVRARKTDAEIVTQITTGGKQMPPFGEALSEEEIRSVVSFLRAKDGWALLPPAEPAKP